MWPLSEVDLLTFLSEMSQKTALVPWLPETKEGWKFPAHPAAFSLEIITIRILFRDITITLVRPFTERKSLMKSLHPMKER